MPVQVWQDMLAAYFPRQGWIRLDHDVLAALGDYRARHGLVSWEETVTRLLAEAARHRPVGGGVVTVSETRLRRARTVADAVLYEGYLLYPYRASSEKNRDPLAVRGPRAARCRRPRSRRGRTR